ncbi:MAG TPA: translation factor GTPase family protein [Trebonia sp.]|nr:translation factor GTPase family protein [Trebonia sp.]
MRTLNLGILAHVDAGKTSLTERLLYAAGVIGAIGRVDDGNTTTDTLALERQRGITIKAAVVSFAIGDVTVNLIDTPGHPDFIAEVERVLSVLDGAVLVISAVEGVQAQTRVLMRTLRRLGIPVLIFINKTDRLGADPERVLGEIREKLTPAAVVPGSADMVEILADHDEDMLRAFVNGDRVPAGRSRDALASQARRGLVYPVLCGSAITGAGTAALSATITEFLPCSAGSIEAALDGTVFKIERGPAGEKIAYIRIFHGMLHVRDRVRFGDGREGGKEAKVTTVTTTSGDEGVAQAGQIARVWGLHDIRIGDTVTGLRGNSSGQANPAGFFAPPTLETAVVPADGTDATALHSALTQLAEQDPLIGLRRADAQIFISLYGEVQKEVIEATLADDFGLKVAFEETTTICVERPVGAGESVEPIGVPPNPFLAGIGLRVEPLRVEPLRAESPGTESPGAESRPGSAGVEFRLGVSPGDMPPAFFTAVEETVHEALREGLHGWQVTGCLVTMTHSGYYPRQSHAHATFDKSMSSTAGDFRQLTPLVVMTALSQAGTAVHEPLHHFLLDLPAERSLTTLTALPRLDAIPLSTTTRGPACVIEGEIPAARIRELQRELPGLTSGEGILETTFDRYVRTRGVPPSRPRTTPDALNRKEYLLHVTRRV